MADDNGVLYLGDGSWGRLRSPQAPDKLNYLASSSRDYHLSLHRIQGEERFHLALDENGRVMDVWPHWTTQDWGSEGKRLKKVALCRADELSALQSAKMVLCHWRYTQIVLRFHITSSADSSSV